MTPEQRRHLVELQVTFSVLCQDKYGRGAAEHHNDLLEMTPVQLLDEAIAECIDQFTYLVTLRNKL